MENFPKMTKTCESYEQPFIINEQCIHCIVWPSMKVARVCEPRLIITNDRDHHNETPLKRREDTRSHFIAARL